MKTLLRSIKYATRPHYLPPPRRTKFQTDESSTVTIDDEETELALEGTCYVKV